MALLRMPTQGGGNTSEMSAARFNFKMVIGSRLLCPAHVAWSCR